MKTVISVSRRTDFVASFPDVLASMLRQRRACGVGPSGRPFRVDLRPENVHTLVFWSKNFSPLIENRSGLRDLVGGYDQIYCHFTVTGLGGTWIERGVPDPDEALSQLPELIRIAGSPERISLRFDPIVFWKEGDEIRSNLPFFVKFASEAASFGITAVRFSFAQWYGKARRRAAKHGLDFVDPEESLKSAYASGLVRTARERGLVLFACCQGFLSGVPGIEPSSCIDGRRLREMHPRGEAVSEKRDKTQRRECRCTESRDIGSYAQSCPCGCLYCYANPAL